MSTKLRPSEISFETICNFLEGISAIVTAKDVKNKWIRRDRAIETFMEDVICRESGEAFDVFRLILPFQDTERGNYKLKEAALGAVYVEALGWPKKSEQAKPLLDWKNPSINGAGDLSAIVERTVSRVTIPNDAPEEERKRLKVGTVNAKLDEMVRAAGSRPEQANILRSLIRQATPRQCKWLTQIILRRMKHKCGEGKLFKAWHNDAQAYYDSHGMSLRAVFNDLKDKERPAMTDVIPGKVVNPQLAQTTFSAEIAIQKLQLYQKEKFGIDSAAAAAAAGRELSFLIETKFDGERIQVHRVGNTINYFSRMAIDHGTKNNYTQMDDAILAATGGTLSDQELKKGGAAASRFDCILDGELIVWNKRRFVHCSRKY